MWVASKFTERGDRVRIKPVKMRLYPDQRDLLAAWIDLERLRRPASSSSATCCLRSHGRSGHVGHRGCGALAPELHLERGACSCTRGRPRSLTAGSRIDSFFGRVKYIDTRLGPVDTTDVATLMFRPFSVDPAMIESPHRRRRQGRVPARRSRPRLDVRLRDRGRGRARAARRGRAQGDDDAAVTGKLYLSTPEGEDNFHARLCNEQPEGWQYLRLHWSGHPVYGKGRARRRHQQAVQALHGHARAASGGAPATRGRTATPAASRARGTTRPCVGKTDEQVAAGFDIDRAGALGARVYAEFDPRLHVVEEGIGYDPRPRARAGVGLRPRRHERAGAAVHVERGSRDRALRGRRPVRQQGHPRRGGRAALRATWRRSACPATCSSPPTGLRIIGDRAGRGPLDADRHQRHPGVPLARAEASRTRPTTSCASSTRA